MRTTAILITLAACDGASTRDAGFPSKQSVEPKPGESAVERPVTREMLVQMFDDMQARSGWDLSKPMLWGYFFVARDRSRLETARRRLEADGYEFVAFVEPEVSTEPLMLHVQKIEVHSVETLLARNEGLYRLAEELGLDSYDGMDVGPVEPAPRPRDGTKKD